MLGSKATPRTVIALGGSLLFKGTNFNFDFLREFKELIAGAVASGRRFIIITGGGRVARNYQQAGRAAGITNAVALDMIGIRVTQANAELVRALLGSSSQPEILRDFEVPIDEVYPVAVGGGVKAGSSKDYYACVWATLASAKVVLRPSNIPFVYSANPKQNPAAKPLEKMTWPEYKELVGEEWTPGLGLPFDPIAAKYAAERRLAAWIFDGTDLRAFHNALDGKPFRGTVIV